MNTTDRSIVVTGCYGFVRGFDLASGQNVWQVQADKYRGPVAFAIVGDRVFAASSFSGLMCLDYRSGQVIWQADLGEVNTATSILAEEGFVAVYKGGQVFCFEPDGKPRWSVEAEAAPFMGLPGNVVAAVHE